MRNSSKKSINKLAAALSPLSHKLAIALSLLALALIPALPVTSALAVTTGEAGASSSDGDSTVPSAPGCTTVQYGGKTWDIIGYNKNGVGNGIAGPNNSVTLLLDNSSYDSSLNGHFDDTSPYINEYAGSRLQSVMNAYATDIGATTDSNVIARDLAGGSALSNASLGYNGDTIAGSAAASQKLWPLSVYEASQLKASVRIFGYRWWLRSPCYDSYKAAIVHSDGHIDGDGYSVNSSHSYGSVRPALYLNLSSSIFSSLTIESATLGAVVLNPTVTDAAGYTWDIVGLNSAGTSKGVNTPQGYATLLLSNNSAKKFQGDVSSDTIQNYYDNTPLCLSNYAGSNLQQKMTEISGLLSGSEYSGKILPRTLKGGSGSYNTTGYNQDNVSDTSDILAQSIWPLSVKEAKDLPNYTRVFGYRWWLRTPGSDIYDTAVAIVYASGGVSSSGYGVYYTGDYGTTFANFAARPALYLNLSSSIFSSLPAGWQDTYIDYSANGHVYPDIKAKIFAGKSRQDTAAQIALEAYHTGAAGVIIANGEGQGQSGKFPDALAASSLAGLLDYPILLTAPDTLPSYTAEALKKLNPQKIIILGDEKSIGTKVVSALKTNNPAAGEPVRLKGANRIDTAVAIYNYGKDKKGGWDKTAIFADASNFPDALAIAPLAGNKHSPIFLVQGSELSKSVKDVFVKPTFFDAVIVGSAKSVSSGIEKQINQALGNRTTTRLEGANRYATAKAIADYSVQQGLSYDNAGIATGENFPDALTGGPLLAKRGSVVLLATDTDTSTLDLIKGNTSISKLHILGGDGAVSPKVRNTVEDRLGWGRGTIG